MNVCLLIESLGAGGAERQLCFLAGILSKRGHGVRVVTYSDGDFYAPLLQSYGVERVSLGAPNKRKLVSQLRRYFAETSPDVVLSFLASASHYCELASLPRKTWALVASERVASPQKGGLTVALKRRLHLLADRLTTNSHSNRLLLENALPALGGRTTTIYNAVDLETFRPRPREGASEGGLRFVIAARLDEQKNVAGFLDGLRIACRDPALRRSVTVDWFGSRNDGAIYRDAQDLVAAYGLHEVIRFLPPVRNIAEQFQSAAAVVLPSFFEGLPNAVCEAMACGRPIVMSGVCDAGNLVDSTNGLLFDPHRPESMAESLVRFSQLTATERSAMGEASRAKAEYLFSFERMGLKYEEVLEEASARGRSLIEHWVPVVPDTARIFLGTWGKGNGRAARRPGRGGVETSEARPRP